MSLVTVSQHDRVILWTLNHPPVNAINGDLLAELEALLDDLEGDTRVRAVVITGQGPTFAAGADIQGFLTGGGSLVEFMERGARLFDRLSESGPPIVAAINGPALGGGNELAMACDIRVATPAARFGQPEVSLGIIPGWGGTVRLPDLVGTAHARRIILTGEAIGADDAYRIGLVDQVVDAPLLLDTALNMGDRLASLPPLALKEIKHLLAQRGAGGMEREQQAGQRLMRTQDAMEGIRAFLDRRRPRFTGQ